MSVDHPYRSFVTFDAGDSALDRVREQLDIWLRAKQWDVDLRESDSVEREDGELVVLNQHDSNSARLRARLVERKPNGNWRTELTVQVPTRAGEGWLLLDVRPDEDRFVAVPNLARYLLGAIDVRDGELPLTDSPRAVHLPQVEELAEAVTDPNRHGLIFVAGTDEFGVDFDPFVDHVRRWTSQVVGQAAAVVLDPLATSAFSEIMEGTHGVQPWTIRTYLPDVDPAVETDALRHRFLTTRRLATASEREIERLLARVARRQAADRPLPKSVERVLRTLSRDENSFIVESVLGGAVREVYVKPPVEVERPPTEPRAESAAVSAFAQIEMVKAILGLPELDEASLRELAGRAAAGVDTNALDRVRRELQDKQNAADDVQGQLDDVRRDLEDEQLEHAIAERDRAVLADENRYLRRQLRAAQKWDVASGPVPNEEITEYPESHGDLLERIEALEADGVVFTGDAEICRDLDAYDTLGKTARTAWDALLVLVDYLRARRAGDWQQGVDEYLHHTPAGYRGLTPGKHAATETAETMRRYGDERTFRVPPECCPQGTATMAAHFKLGHIGRLDPRMHYFDDFTGTGKIYVGYIGPHLTSVQTKNS